LAAFSFSLGVIIATALFSCSNSSAVGAANIANSLLPFASANRFLIRLP
jgi:hypothetical protein